MLPNRSCAQCSARPTGRCPSAILQAKRLSTPEWAWESPGVFEHLAPLAMTVCILLGVPPGNEGFQSQLPRLAHTEWTAGDTALARRLEAELQAEGHHPLLTAEEQERIFLLLKPHAARMLEEKDGAQPPRITAAVRQAVRHASSSLVHLYPSSGMHKQVHAFTLSLDPTLGGQTAAAYRAALQALEATNCEWSISGVGSGGGVHTAGVRPALLPNGCEMPRRTLLYAAAA